ncbi:MAG: hypothetical protein IPK91_05945 [Saprospiraceae bacterium]|nr:hypothetical protein [Saprospiraceae bacterium]MBK8296812.1 hypothetical protein [Saprospiraceae bacterium]
MKNSILLQVILLLLTSKIIFSQAIPNKFNYQVSIRDDNGDPIVDKEVSFRISILVNPNSPSNFSYREEHSKVFTSNGVASFIIGNGNTKYGRFDTLSFQTQAYFLKIELDEGNVSNFKDLSMAQLLSVPYSMVAKQLDKNNAQIGQVLKWDGSKWKPDIDNSSGGGTLAGDVTGSTSSNKVEKIQNRPVSATAPSTGQVLKFDGTQWKPDIDNSSGGGTLAGDVTGSTSSNKVEKIQNRPVSATAPSTGQVLKFDGTQWKPDIDNSSGGGTLAGDVTGLQNSNKVEKIQNRLVSAIAPSSGQVLKFNSSTNTWTPSADSDQQTLSIVGSALSISNGNSINLPNNNGTNLWSTIGNAIYNSNQGPIKIGYNSPTDGELIVHKGNEKPTDKILFFGYKIGASPNFGSLANIGILDKGTNILRIGFRYTGSTYELFGTTKSFVVDHPKYFDSLIVYTCIEGPEAAAYERGTSKLVNGRADIKFSEHFGLIINPGTLTIQLTPGSLESKGLAIIEKNAQGVTIGELQNGKGNYSFDWEVKAVRKGFENNRVIRHISEYQINPNESQK